METSRRRWFRSPFFWLVVIGCLTMTALRPFMRHVPEPPPVLAEIPAWSLTAHTGEPFGSADLAGDVYVASFFFTRCTAICPFLTQAVSDLAARYEREGVEGIRIVGITVDPDHDTVDVLADYAELWEIDPERWRLLTGDPDTVREVVVDAFMTPMDRDANAPEGIVDIAHSGKLLLVDGEGNLRGLYDHDLDGLDETFHRSVRVLWEARGR